MWICTCTCARARVCVDIGIHGYMYMWMKGVANPPQGGAPLVPAWKIALGFSETTPLVGRIQPGAFICLFGHHVLFLGTTFGRFWGWLPSHLSGSVPMMRMDVFCGFISDGATCTVECLQTKQTGESRNLRISTNAAVWSVKFSAVPYCQSNVLIVIYVALNNVSLPTTRHPSGSSGPVSHCWLSICLVWLWLGHGCSLCGTQGPGC